MRKLLLTLCVICLPSAAWATCSTPCVVATGCMTSGTTCTTASVNTTGANFISAQIAGLDPTSSCTFGVTDNKANGNATALTVHRAGMNDVGEEIFYWTNPTVGTGHTFTITATVCASSFVNFQVEAFSGMATASVIDAGSDRGGGNTGLTTLAAGSFTPSQACDVTIAVLALNSGATSQSVTIPVLTIVSQVDFTSAMWFGETAAYAKQTGLSGINPTFSWSGSASAAVGAATFKSASTTCAGTGANSQLMLVGVGQ